MATSSEDTPLLKQYFSIKAQHPEAILLYRVGDFYETYSDDALLVGKVLGLVLTRRSNGDKGTTPMAGFPHHALDNYLPKLIRSGYKVAICDQLEDPALCKSKLVKRGITEILTPGIAFGDEMLRCDEHNYLAGLCFEGEACGIAFLDVSTGTFQLTQGSYDYIQTLLASFAPKELVVQSEIARRVKERFEGYYTTTLDEWAFVQEAAEEKLRSQLKVPSLKGYAIDIYPLAIRSAGALLAYLEQTHHAGLANICALSRIDEDKFVWMDRFTLRNLEVFESSAGRDGVSLVQTLDRCRTGMGSRLLRTWLSMPIMNPAQLEKRYDIVGFLADNSEALQKLQEYLGNVGDLERTLSRVATGKIAPREMLQLSRSLSQNKPIYKLCSDTGLGALEKLISRLHSTEELSDKIVGTLASEPAAQIGKGDVIKSGVNSELDSLREISHSGKGYLDRLRDEEAAKAGISSLRIGYNNVFGYYIEVRNGFKDKVPAEWIRKQTLVNAERYITSELKEYEEKILGADENIYRIESEIYASLVAYAQRFIRDIQENCTVLSTLDTLQGFAQQALDRNYCRPLVDKSNSLEIVAGRHPVIETTLPEGEEYVPNDLSMDSRGDQIIILTGPNMSGKSALLRQTALIVLMAQIGSFVPAQKARFGYFDKLFTRVGASDNISRGESTFMVEMLETSMILHNLSERSLVLLDEIGRGTSTYDGMSIARAIVEYIQAKGHGAKTLFATHYHELNDLENKLRRVVNYHIAVKEEGHDIIFLRRLEKGGVAHSFGIHVARLAGMPREVLENAEKTLRELELREKHAGNMELESDGSVQLSLFQLDDPTLGSIKEKLEGADLNNLTPLQAFDLLRSMKAELGLL